MPRAKKINEYAKRYGTRGFRSGSMYRNQDWYDAFEFSYDMSGAELAHLEPAARRLLYSHALFVGKSPRDPTDDQPGLSLSTS